MAEQTFSAGETIFREGDQSDEAYIIRAGHVEVIKESPEGSVVIACLEPGDIFGEMGIVDERPRSLTAVAVDEVVVTTVTRDEFVDFLFQNPQEGIKYIRVLFERLRAMNARILPEKTYALDLVTPRKASLTLIPLTEESAKAVSRNGLTIDHFPFRVGRISMKDEPGPLDVNNLYLTDSVPFNVSRNHFLIDRTHNDFVIIDRGSYLGTVVNGEHIGGNRSIAEATLKEGENEVIQKLRS